MMTRRFASTAVALGIMAAALMPVAQLADAQQPHTTSKPVSLSSLVVQGFEIKAVTGNQSGVVGTLVLQKDKDVYLCDAKDLSIQPTAFECWPVK
jgi:hypothetical protein